MNYEQITMARGLATPIPQTQRAADKSPMMQVQYVPNLGTGGTAATCRVSGTTMTFTVDAAAPTGADAIGVSGVIDLTDTTMEDNGASFDGTAVGGVLDLINAVPAYRAYLIGALRADAATLLVDTATASIIGDTGLTLMVDSSEEHGAMVPGTAGTNSIVTTAISGERFVNNGVYGHVKDADDHCENSLLHADIDLGNATTGNKMYFYSANQTDKEVVLLGSITLTEDTLKTFGQTGAYSNTHIDGVGDTFLTAKRGERLIIRAAAWTALDAWAQFDIVGKTAVLKNNRVVEDLNFTP